MYLVYPLASTWGFPEIPQSPRVSIDAPEAGKRFKRQGRRVRGRLGNDKRPYAFQAQAALRIRGEAFNGVLDAYLAIDHRPTDRH